MEEDMDDNDEMYDTGNGSIINSSEEDESMS